MLPWSVMPIAGWPSAAAVATTLVDPGRAVEHRVLGVDVEVGERIAHDGVSTSLVRIHRRVHGLWTNHTRVIRRP